jgi:hypothetical protein
LVAPAAYRRHRRHAERGHYDWVIGHTSATLSQLGDDAGPQRWGPGVVARLGAALARRQELAAARVELTRALAALPGSLAQRDLGSAEVHELQLVEVLVVMGEFAEANRRAAGLWQAERHPAIRLAAARTHAAVHLAGGDLAGAHAWLDEAASRAAGLGGDLGLALVHADRASVVAESGRIHEAVAMATEALARLDRARTSHPSNQALPAAQAVMTANAVAMAAAHHGDVLSAQLLHAESVRRATIADRPVTAAQLDITASAVLRLTGDLAALGGNHSPAERAAVNLAVAQAEPARAMAVREQALVAHATGQMASAHALAMQALGLFDRLQMPTESARTRALVDLLAQ